MMLNTKQIASISEANQNLSRMARMAEKHGELYIPANAEVARVGLSVAARRGAGATGRFFKTGVHLDGGRRM